MPNLLKERLVYVLNRDNNNYLEMVNFFLDPDISLFAKEKNSTQFLKNELDKEVNLKKAKEILDKTNGVLLDVSSHQEYNEEHLPGAININLYDLKKEITDKIKNKETTIVVYCSCGVRSKKAKEILEELGYTEVYNLKEGLYCYRKEL